MSSRRNAVLPSRAPSCLCAFADDMGFACFWKAGGWKQRETPPTAWLLPVG